MTAWQCFLSSRSPHVVVLPDRIVALAGGVLVISGGLAGARLLGRCSLHREGSAGRAEDSGERVVGSLISILQEVEQVVCFLLQVLGYAAQRMVLGSAGCSGRMTYSRGVVRQTVLPDLIQIVGELGLVLVLVALDISEHCRQVHRPGDICASANLPLGLAYIGSSPEHLALIPA